MRLWLGLLIALLWTGLSVAQERITDYDVDIVVETSGDLMITETIRVVADGNEIKRGIFRELPASYTLMGVRRPFDYELIDVLRDGQAEPVTILRNGNAIVWRTGSADVLLDPGSYNYSFRYRVENWVRRFDDRDELYWNVLGTYSVFPVEQARVTVQFPQGAIINDLNVYTGPRGAKQSNATIQANGIRFLAETTQTLPPRHGMTISASIDKGIIDPMSASERTALFWIRYGAPIIGGLGGLLLLIYYYTLWNRVGRDPQQPPVFARYDPPKGYSPAAVHYIYHRYHKGFDALSAQLLQMGTEGAVEIEAEKDVTTLTLTGAPQSRDSRKLTETIFSGRDRVVMDGETDSALYKDVTDFMADIGKRYGKTYYQRNLVWAFLGFFASVALFIAVMVAPVAKSGLLVATMLIGLLILNGLFLFLLPAPTKRGSTIHAEIEGFKLYLETAEEDRINTGGPLSDRPPAMTVELYERFLPYAVALGVEKPWTTYFKTVLPKEAAAYNPPYAHGSRFTNGRGVPMDFGKQLGKALTVGVAAAAPVSQSSGSGFSSGGGGGGFSGGGGGGGGVGGW